MGKALTWIGGALLLLLSALFLVPHVVDWNNLRGSFEEEASRALGREVRVGGKINVRLLPSPYVRFEQLRIADTAGTLGEPFFRADSFHMGLAIAPLVRGALEATHIELHRPVLALAIDADGRGNWRDVQISPAAAAVLPAEVKLNAVEIVEGVLAVKGSDGELLRLTGLSGELSADSLRGPFKYRGQAVHNGEPRELRLATAEMEPNGDLRFKASARVASSGASYALDGKLADLAGKPRLEGEVAARIPLAAAGRDAHGAAGESLEMRGKLTGTALGAALADIAIAFDQGGTPQIVLGEASAEWRDGMRLKLSLSSRWLDLDRIAGAQAASPHQAVRALVPAIVKLLPERGQIDVRLGIDLASLGGEAVADLGVHLERFRGPLQVRELRAALPGGARLDMNGTMTVAGDAAFAGDVGLRGASLGRFLAWAAKGQTVLDARHDGAFAVQGRLALNAAGLELGGLSAELLGAAPLTGTLAWRWSDRRRLDVRLAGRELDVSPVLPGVLDPARIKAVLWPAAPAAAGGGASPQPDWLDSRAGDTAVALKVDRLGDGERWITNVDAAFALEQGRLQVSRARLGTADGVRLDLEGEIAGLDGTPKGSLSGDVGAHSAEALDSILQSLDLKRPDKPSGHDKLVPMRLAGSLHLGQRAAGSTDLDLDGVIRGQRATARLRLDAGPGRWRDGHVAIDARIDDAGAALALGELLTGETWVARAALPPQGGQLRLKAIGRPQAGMVATATLDGDKLTMGFDGRIRTAGSGRAEVDGTARLALARSAPVLAMLGLGSLGRLGEAEISGTADVASKGEAWVIRPRGLVVAGEPVSGEVTLTRTAGKPTRIEASLDLAKAALPDLVGAIVAKAPPASPGEPKAPASGLWPEEAFDLAVLDQIQGKVRLGLGRLLLEPGLQISDAAIDLELSPNALRISNLDGRAFDGDLKARLVIERSPSLGAAIAGALRIDDARLESLAGRTAASGSAGVIVQFSGRATSPQLMITGLQGKGEITLASSVMQRLSPSVVPRAVSAVLEGKTPEAPGEALRKAVLEGLARPAPVRIGPAKVPLQIGNGALRIGQIDYETEDGRGSVTSTVEMAMLKVDSEWRLQAKTLPKLPSTGATGTAPGAAGDDKAAPPGISVVYVGPLRSLATLEPRVSTDALERVVTLWRMERDVAELERLRREDEERQRREIERQRQLDQERARARESGLAPPTQLSVPGGTPTPVERRLDLRLPPPAPAGGGVLPPAAGALPPAPAPAPAAAATPSGGTTGSLAGGGAVAGEAGLPPLPPEADRRPPPRQGPARPPRPPAFNPFPSVPN
jgi:hypothetical protein